MRRLACALLLAGCVVPDPHPRFTPAWEPFDPSAKDWRTTRKALLVSDTQIHNIYSKSLPERSLAIKAVSGVAIRPPPLDLFARDVLEWILKNGAPDADLVLHLGDGLNLACTGELDTFLAVMAQAGKPWFMVPGNHDFYYFGVCDPRNRKLWQDASYGGGELLTKDRFIRLYLAALLKQDDAGIRALRESLGSATDLPASLEWRAPEGTPGFLDAIAWSIDAERPWRSFVIQEIDMTGPAPDDPHISVLLMDSNQYSRAPVSALNGWESYPLALNSGLTGEMLPDQLRVARKWIEGGPGGREGKGRAVLMFHHPFSTLEPRTRSSLGWLWRENQIGVVVTAHTHEGYFKHHDLGRGPERIELNVGSTTDWPMEWRTLQGYVSPNVVYIRTPRFTLTEALRQHEGFFLREWEVPLDAPDDYRRYKQGEAGAGLLFDFYLTYHMTPPWMPEPSIQPNAAARDTERSVKDTMLWTYERLIHTFPTDPHFPAPWPLGCNSDAGVLKQLEVMAAKSQTLESKIAFLKELETFDRGRHSADPKTGEPTDDARMRYRISQAAWASRFEKAQGRRLQVEDDLIRVAEK